MVDELEYALNQNLSDASPGGDQAVPYCHLHFNPNAKYVDRVQAFQYVRIGFIIGLPCNFPGLRWVASMP